MAKTSCEVVLLIWEDIQSSDGWCSQPMELFEKLRGRRCITVGMLVDEDEFAYYLCRDALLSEDGAVDSLAGQIMIPKGVVSGLVKVKNVKFDLDDYEQKAEGKMPEAEEEAEDA
jgi:hypothetical protein